MMSAVFLGKASYEGLVVARSIRRAGLNKNIKGHIHEVLTMDSISLRGILVGEKASLTKSSNSKVVDLVVAKGGKVVERLQLKDTLSLSSVNKLVRDVSQNKYQSARLVGTEETVALVNDALKKAGLGKRMVSSGFSSRTTTSLAYRAGTNSTISSANAIGNAARSGGAIGASVAVGLEMAAGLSDFMGGKRDATDVAGSVVKAGAKGYVTGAAASAAATAGAPIIATGFTAIGASAGLTAVAAIAVPAVLAVSAGCLVGRFFEWVFD